jgi:hypothetical protein
MRAAAGSAAGAELAAGPATRASLAALGIPFDELVFGAVEASFFIGGRSVDPVFDIRKEIGF